VTFFPFVPLLALSPSSPVEGAVEVDNTSPDLIYAPYNGGGPCLPPHTSLRMSSFTHADPFGNYLCQKIVEKATNEQRLEMVRQAGADLVSISLSPYSSPPSYVFFAYCRAQRRSFCRFWFYASKLHPDQA